MSERPVLIEATIDRVDTDLVSAEAGRDPQLVRILMQDRYYFVDARDVGQGALKAAAALPAGLAVTACVGVRQGRANIFWLKGARPVESKDKGRAKDRLESVAIAPSDVHGQARRSFKTLSICVCVMAVALLVMAMTGLQGSAVLMVLSILAAIISFVVGALCTVGLIEALDPMRRAAQSSWSRP